MSKLKVILSTCFIFMLIAFAWSEMALGAVAQWGSHNYDALLLFPPTYPPRQQLATLILDKQDNLPFQVGRLCGSTVAILQGVIEIIDGRQRVQVGLVVSVENVVIGGAVTVSGVAEGVHGAVVATKGMAGWIESTGNILKMAKGKGGGGGGKDYTFPKEPQLAKRLGIDEENIHMVKGYILNDEEIAPLLKLLGANNPDIGYDDVGNIVLKNVITGKTIQTNIPLDSFRGAW